MKKSALIISLIAFALRGVAQQWDAAAEVAEGFVIEHSKRMAHLAQSHPVKLELSAQKQTDGRQRWHHVYNLPKVAYSLVMLEYGHPQLGQTIAGNVQFIYPFVKKERWSWNLVFGFGGAYNTRSFDPDDNSQNILLGSRITGCLNGKSYLSYHLSPATTVHAGIGLVHFSNGSTKLPNLGINVPNVHLGVVYETGKMNPMPNDFAKPEYDRFNYSVEVANGWIDVAYSGGPRHWYNGISAKAHMNTSPINRISVGTDFMYDRSIGEFRTHFGLENDRNYNAKWGVLAGHELRIGQVWVTVNYGVYLYQGFNNVYAKAYQRYQLKYLFHKHLYLAGALKAHRGAADVMEWTLGLEY